jgi:serine/threonine protein kinase
LGGIYLWERRLLPIPKNTEGCATPYSSSANRWPAILPLVPAACATLLTEKKIWPVVKEKFWPKVQWVHSYPSLMAQIPEYWKRFLYENGKIEKQLVFSNTLGNGWQGRVVRATFEGKNVVVKINKAAEHALLGSIRELEILRRLPPSPFLPKFFDFYIPGYRSIGLILALFNGAPLLEKNLAGKMQPQSLPIEKVVKIAKQALSALAVTHERGVIHSDCRPTNLMWDPETEKFCLIDFGNAFDTTDLPPPNRGFTQTAQYRAPEVVFYGDHYLDSADPVQPLARPIAKITPKIDVWSLAISLAELYTECPLIPNYEDQLPDKPKIGEKFSEKVREKRNQLQAAVDRTHLRYLELLLGKKIRPDPPESSTNWQNHIRSLPDHLHQQPRCSLREEIQEAGERKDPGKELQVQQFTDLILEMLEPNQKNRPSSAKALENPLFKETLHSTSETRTKV